MDELEILDKCSKCGQPIYYGMSYKWENKERVHSHCPEKKEGNDERDNEQHDKDR